MFGTVGEVITNILLELGPMGMILIAVLDSSLLSIPEINDVIVVTRILHRPVEVLYWPLLAAIGSALGCLLLYTLARKGGETFLRRRFSAERVNRVEQFYARYGVLALLIPALCPPPTPFKIFVATAGALRYPRAKFVLTILLARSARYYTEGILTLLYGRAVLQYMREHWGMIILGIGTVALIGSGIVCARKIRRQAPGPAESGPRNAPSPSAHHKHQRG
jgi:membrane protein YqaA with SNARE-associated domain